jgi:dihydrofolate reductase
METTKPFLNMVVAMDENNSIGCEGKIPWIPLPTDHHWYLTHSTTTKDPSKRVALILGRLTFDETIKFSGEYLPRWHFIVISRQSPDILLHSYSNIDRNHIDIVNSFDQAIQKAKLLINTSSAMIESIFVFGGVRPYEDAMISNLVKRIYLTRIFAKVPNCDARISKFDLSNFQRIKRSNDEILAEFDDKIIEENEWTYQFQVYERIDL